MYRGYKARLYFWEVLVLLRKLAIVLVASFGSSLGSFIQAMILFILLVVFLAMNIKVSPFSKREVNDVESLPMVCSILSVYAGLYYVLTSDSAEAGVKDYQSLKTFLWLFIWAVNGLFFLYWFLHFRLEIKDQVHGKSEKAYNLLFNCCLKKKIDKDARVRSTKKKNRRILGTFDAITDKLQTIYKVYLRGDRIRDHDLLVQKQQVIQNDLKNLNCEAVEQTEEVNKGTPISVKRDIHNLKHKKQQYLSSNLSVHFSQFIGASPVLTDKDSPV